MKRKEATNGGGCHGKKFGCKLGALQRDFPKLAFLRQGGDVLRPSSQIPFCGKSSILSNFIIFWTNSRQSLVQYHLLTRHLHCLLKYVDFSWFFFCHHDLLGFVDQFVFEMSMIFFLHIIQRYRIVLNHLHWTLGKDHELSTLRCLHLYVCPTYVLYMPINVPPATSQIDFEFHKGTWVHNPRDKPSPRWVPLQHTNCLLVALKNTLTHRPPATPFQEQWHSIMPPTNYLIMSLRGGFWAWSVKILVFQVLNFDQFICN